MLMYRGKVFRKVPMPAKLTAPRHLLECGCRTSHGTQSEADDNAGALPPACTMQISLITKSIEPTLMQYLVSSSTSNVPPSFEAFTACHWIQKQRLPNFRPILLDGRRLQSGHA
eukprot:scaffold274692_cov42-Prasinocladus_malaysianus.AAC.1